MTGRAAWLREGVSRGDSIALAFLWHRQHDMAIESRLDRKTSP